MRKFIILFAVCLMLTSTAHAYSYDFGGDPIALGKSTSIDIVLTPDATNNVRNNKDVAFMPPPYGYFGGVIPTDSAPSSYYTADITTPSTPTISTAPMYYADGSIGTLYVARTGKAITVYEGEDLSNLAIGAGHFTITSVWNGNVALAGHNRSGYFGFVKDMQSGDRITYTTLYGSRVYEVFSKEQIGDMDYGKLGWSADNILTLITCVENVSELRWAVQLREIK